MIKVTEITETVVLVGRVIFKTSWKQTINLGSKTTDLYNRISQIPDNKEPKFCSLAKPRH